MDRLLGRRRNAWEGYPNGEPTWYRWEGSQELGTYADGAADWDIGDIERYYIPGLAEVAGDEPGGQNAEWRYYLTDHLGSVRNILGEGREMLARYAYTPYGETALEAGLPLHVGFTGHLWEPQTGQYFAPFRYYSPGNGRWLTRDPLGFVDGPNVYGYLPGVNPISYIDPTGQWITTVVGAVTGAVIGALDQAGCGLGSVLAGAALGGVVGTVGGYGLIPGMIAGAIGGGVDGGIRGGADGVVPGVIGGFIGGGVAGGLVGRPGVTVAHEIVGGIAAGSWINVGPKVPAAIGNGKQPGCIL